MVHGDFKEFLKCLNSHRVRYLIVGGFAFAAHVKPRFTGDLDVFVDATPANARRILAALRDFGFGALKVSERDFAEPRLVVRLGRFPVGIDILTCIAAVDFAEAWPARVRTRLDGVRVAVIGREHFIRNKRAVGRAQDLWDVSHFDKAPKKR